MTCPRCRHDNRPGAKFCGECAAPLAPQRFRAPEAYTPKHLAERILTSKAALEGERKQVTVLFADLKGSMELLADRDPEEARTLLDPVLQLMMDAVHRYEGTVNQVMGDGAATPTTAGRWPWPSPAACARSSPTAIWALGKLYRRTGKQDQAQGHLVTAATMYREMDLAFWLSSGRHQTRKLHPTNGAFVVRHSAVVLSEFRRGARSRAAQRLVDQLDRLATTRWEPSAGDWWEAGRLIRQIGDARRWDRNKRRDFKNDALIALTARHHGATIVTANRADFELLARAIRVSVLSV